ncbi:MAG: TetR family transcriptional regulator C-terminal domain-containing protein, partial [Gammaproteobacteria bacterium]|nr:TetR family transcriptional regulator C-terminal domain-containing protein [Gammaproteobacteria bacterium]
EDLNSKNTTMFFPELWSLANHQASATQLMDDMYAQYRAVLKEVIKEINPKLKPSSVDRLALFISASIEGHTVFIGHGKPWQKQTKKLIKIATQSFLFAIESEEF